MTQQPYFSEYPSSSTGYSHVGYTVGVPPLDQPWYGIGFIPAIARVFRKYAIFKGRASRGEYWWFFLLSVIVAGVLLVVLLIGAAVAIGSSDPYSLVSFDKFADFLTAVAGAYALVTFIPSLSVAVRRLHDIGKSGYWYCIYLIPGTIVTACDRLGVEMNVFWFFIYVIALIGSIWLIVLLATHTYPGPTQWDIPLHSSPQADPPPGYAQHNDAEQGYSRQGYVQQTFDPQASTPSDDAQQWYGQQPSTPYPPQYPPQGTPYPPQDTPYPPQDKGDANY